MTRFTAAQPQNPLIHQFRVWTKWGNREMMCSGVWTGGLRLVSPLASLCFDYLFYFRRFLL